MLEDSSDRGELTRKGWGIPGALVLGISAYFLPMVVLVFFVPGVESLLFSTNVTNFLYTLIFEVLVIATLFIFVKAYGLRLRDLGLNKFKPSNLWFVPAAFLAYIVSSVVISYLVGLFFSYDQNQAQDIGFSSPAGLETVLIFVALVVLAPLAEELLFRGFIFQGIRKRLKFWPTAVAVSLLFALVHGQVNVGLDVFALSLVLCWLRERTGSLWPPMMLHAFKNGLAFFLIFTPQGQQLMQYVTGGLPF